MTRIEQARDYVIRETVEPVLASPDIDPHVRRVVTHSKQWLTHFKRVGDLLAYLKRFEGGTDAPMYRALKALGLPTFEDIVAKVEARFGTWAADRTTLDDFVVGERYSSQDILIFVGTYDTRAGGMFAVGQAPDFEAVVIKATLEGGRYANAWLIPHERLKYFLKSRMNPTSKKTEFKESFQENQAILSNPRIPIYAFVRDTNAGEFVFEGIFRYQRLVSEQDGSKWFELAKGEAGEEVPMVRQEYLEQELRNRVAQSQHLSQGDRQRRLAAAEKIPKRVIVQTTGFVRNSDVIAEVLARAAGKCEGCRAPAPFNRKSDGTPYLEVHHRIQLAAGGEDTPANAMALCPNCHRKAHYG